MNTNEPEKGSDHDYDIMNFEVLGEEAVHLEEEIEKAKKAGALPEGLRYFITPSSVQEYLAVHPSVRLPDIVTIKTHSRLPETFFEGKRKSVLTRSAGYDHVEGLATRANVTSLREYCVNAVAQTAMKFLYAAAGDLNQYERNATTFLRSGVPSFLELSESRTLAVFGVGRIGKRVHDLARANGLHVVGVDLRKETLSAKYGGSVEFVSKERAVRESDVIVNAMSLQTDPKSPFFNTGYFSREVLAESRKGLIIINVTRGEIAPESVLLEFYRSGHIRGIGLDVFSRESDFARALSEKDVSADPDIAAAKTMVELSVRREANIYVQPHQAFNSDVAARIKAVETMRHLVAYYRNGGARFDDQLPYTD